jgi:hypothetical protein
MKKLIYLILIVLIILPFLDGNFETLNIYGKIYEFVFLSLLGLFYYKNDFEPNKRETYKPQKF